MGKGKMTWLLTGFMVFTVMSTLAQGEKKTITLEDVFLNRKFSSKGVYGIQPMKNGDHYCQLKKDSLNIYSYESGKYLSSVVFAKELVPAGDTAPVEMSGFTFSEDESRILFANDEEPIYRRSSKANYFVFDCKTRKIIPLSTGGKQRLATFSPDGSKVAFVRDNNLFVVSLPEDFNKPGKMEEKQVTSDGKMNEIINGATDWVYEEEFEFSQAFSWSPDGSRIAFYRFDESGVKEYQLTYYGDLYPEQYKYKYPKAGEDNSVVTLHIYGVKSGKTLHVDLGNEKDIYIPRMKWTEDPEILAFYRMNRHQNLLELMLADASNGKTSVIYREENKYYIEINDQWHFLKNGREFLLTSEKDGYRHIYLYDLKGKLLNQVTTGKWEVTDLHGVDEDRRRLFFSAAKSSPINREICSVSLDGKDLKVLSMKTGSNIAAFSSNYSWCLVRWSDINTPPSTYIMNSNGEEVRMIQDNAKLKETIQTYSFGKTDFFTCKASDGTDLNGFMLKPANFDPSKRYPVLFTIYGGPGSQTVNNSWGSVSSWNQLWAQNGIVVVSVDNRGTGGRGEEFKKCTYLQLGKYETMDQVDAARYLCTLPWVDSTRIGMWGWSFGGYLTLSCMTRGAGLFDFGIAVAPVTNWKYYDNIYTERFMRTPKENESGYEDNSPVSHAAKLNGDLLIIHGMADDNVHPQNSYDMMTALVAAGKQFESQFYPNSNHGIYTGKNTTFHLYKRMTSFILENL